MLIIVVAGTSGSRSLLSFRRSRSGGARAVRCIQSQTSSRVPEHGGIRRKDTFRCWHANTCKAIGGRNSGTLVEPSSREDTKSLWRGCPNSFWRQCTTWLCSPATPERLRLSRSSSSPARIWTKSSHATAEYEFKHESWSSTNRRLGTVWWCLVT